MIDRSLNYGRCHIKKFLKSVAPYNNVVDLGAGTGVDLGLAKEVQPSAEIHGIEVNAPYVKNLQEKGWKIHSINIEKDKFPFENESLDVVMANQIIEHVKEIFWIFDQVSRVLKVGGHLILGVPNLASLHNRLLLLLGCQPTAIHVGSAHVRGYTKSGLVRFFDEVSPHLYKLKSFKGANFYPFPPILAKPLAAVFPSLAWGCFLLLEKKAAYRGEFLEYAAPGKLETNYFVG